MTQINVEYVTTEGESGSDWLNVELFADWDAVLEECADQAEVDVEDIQEAYVTDDTGLASHFKLPDEYDSLYECATHSADEEAKIAYIDIYLNWNSDNFDEAYQGEYDSDEAFAQQMAEDIGAFDGLSSWPHNCIDWEYAARELMYDYSASDGHYFKDL